MMAIHAYHVIIPRGVCHVIPNFTVFILRKENMPGAWLKSKHNSLQTLMLQSK